MAEPVKTIDLPEDGWRYFCAVLKRNLQNGQKVSGDLMRRRVQGRWQYRELTDRESDAQKRRDLVSFHLG